MRYEDWPTRLDQVIRDHREKPFRYGSMDCALFAANCVKAMTGTDPASGWRSRYKSHKKAQALIEEYGSLEAITRLQLGSAIAPQFAQRGDVVLTHIDGESIGVCLGARIVMPHESRGVAYVPMREAVMAWSV